MLDIDEMKIYCNGLRETCKVLDGAFGIVEHSRFVNAIDQDMFSFLREIAASDAEPNDDEKEYIDAFVKSSVYGEKLYNDTLEWDSEAPCSLKLFVNAENKLMEIGEVERKVPKTGQSSPVAIWFKVFSIVGAGMMTCDKNVTNEEVKHFTGLIKSYQRYIFENLKKTDFGSAFNVAMVVTEDDEAKETIYMTKENSDETISTKIKEASKFSDKLNNYRSDSTLSKLLEKLNDLVGLDGVKSEVESLINLINIQKIRQSRGMKQIPISYHMVFTGNPGTGKTTIARLMSEIYRELGVLSKGSFVETDRSGLVAGYVGQTALKVQEKVKEALGGILFIDEAYSLVASDSPNDFGREAIDTLVKAMEDNRDDLIVIVAGYTEPMKKFINSNPGLRSRFNKYLDFPDYNPEELTEIFRRMCKSNGYDMSSDAETAIQKRFTEMYENRDETFGNGRDVRNIFEKAVIKQASRLSSIKSPTNTQIITLEASDVE